MNKGEIILITFPFTDLSGRKLRPALVLAADRDDVTMAFITTNLQQLNELPRSKLRGIYDMTPQSFPLRQAKRGERTAPLLRGRSLRDEKALNSVSI